MNNNILIQVPETHFQFFAEIFETAAQNKSISVDRQCRITQMFADMKQQRTENDKLIYTSFSKSDIKKMLEDLQLYYRNTNRLALLTRVDLLIKELSK